MCIRNIRLLNKPATMMMKILKSRESMLIGDKNKHIEGNTEKLKYKKTLKKKATKINLPKISKANLKSAKFLMYIIKAIKARTNKKKQSKMPKIIGLEIPRKNSIKNQIAHNINLQFNFNREFPMISSLTKITDIHKVYKTIKISRTKITPTLKTRTTNP